MAAAKQSLRFFTDENIPDSIVAYLRGRGHSVYRCKSHLPEGTPDPVVATTAMEDNRILISQDKDFNHQRFEQPRFAKLSRIGLTGHGPELLAAVKEHIHLVEAQWSHKAAAQRMIARLKVGQVKFSK
jgi:hypothetical protein